MPRHSGNQVSPGNLPAGSASPLISGGKKATTQLWHPPMSVCIHVRMYPCPYVSMSVSNELLHICVVYTLVGWKYAARCNLSWLIPQLFWPPSTCRRLPGISCWYTLRKQIERRNNLASPPHIAIAASKPHGKQSNDIHLIGHQRPPRGLHKLKRGSAHYY